MKTCFVILFIILAIGGCVHTSTIKEVKELTHKVDSLENQTKEQKKFIKFMEKELEFKELEISYWGHKYDSCRVTK